MTPTWLVVLAIVSLAPAFISLGFILVDELTGDHALMLVMKWVWPITALSMGPFAIWAYWTMDRSVPMRHDDSSSGSGGHGRQQQEEQQQQQADLRRWETGGQTEQREQHGGQWQGGQEEQGGQSGAQRPFWQQVFKGVTHCGAGCTLGDIIGEWIVYLAGITIAGTAIWPEYIADYLLAYALGIAFQYFAIAPMRGLGVKDGIIAAIKADMLSLTAFEVGLFAWMAITSFVIFNYKLHPDNPVYWFMMQIGMVIGFGTAYPMNWWLIKKGM